MFISAPPIKLVQDDDRALQPLESENGINLDLIAFVGIGIEPGGYICSMPIS